MPTGRIRSIYNQGSRYVDRVQFSPDGQLLATASRDRGLRIIDATPENGGTVLLETSHVGNTALQWMRPSDGARSDTLLWLNREGEVEIVRIDPEGDPPSATIGHITFDAPMHLIAIKGRTLIAIAWAIEPTDDEHDEAPPYSILQFDLAAPRVSSAAQPEFTWRLVEHLYAEGPPPTQIALVKEHNSSRLLLATGSAAGRVELWEHHTDHQAARDSATISRSGVSGAPSARLLWSGAATGSIDSLAFSHDRSRIAVGRVGGVDLLDAATGAHQATLPHEIGRVVGLAFLENDSALVAAGEDHPLAIFDAGSDEHHGGLPSEVLHGRSLFRQARLIADPLFASLVTSRRVVEQLRERKDLPAWKREAAIEYAKGRGDHLAGMASSAIFSVRRGEYDIALILYETIQAAAGANAPLWDSYNAMLHFLLGNHEKSQEILTRYMEWSERPVEISAADWALAAFLANAKGSSEEAAEAWRRARQAAADAGVPTSDLEQLIWRKALANFGSLDG